MVSAVIPAAGKGTRMNNKIKKQFLKLKGKPIIAHTLEKFQNSPEIDEIILVVSEDDLAFCREKIIKEYGFSKVSRVVAGGPTRQDSVWRGLQAISSYAEYIMVHDGARPFITPDLIRESIIQVKEHGAVAVAVPVNNTIKLIDERGFVENTPPRHLLRVIQTPQTFDAPLLFRAFSEALRSGFVGTDEATLVERIKSRVKIIPGSHNNIKITTPKDLFLAEMIIDEYGEDD